MLGVRLIFMGLSASLDSDQEKHAEMLCAANQSIPCFWLAAFSVDDIQLIGEPAYPVLSTSKEQAVKRLKDFEQSGLMALSSDEAVNNLYQRWCQFIEDTEFPVLAIDTFELFQSLDDSSVLQADITEQLRLLEVFSQKAQAEPCGEQQLERLGLYMGEGQTSFDSISLAGYGW